jgi:transcriptional regulator with XRE-family HTH domain
MAYEYGRGAEMRVARTFFGLEQDEMATVLRVRIQSYQRWENGRDAIPEGVWAEVARLYERFDEQVAGLLASIPAGDQPHEVRVWRGKTAAQPFPGLWLRIVGEAMRQEPRIVPRYPDDSE